MSKAIRAVLFDMDGTLVQTEEHWGEAMFTLAERLGGEMSTAARQRTVGTSMRTAMAILHEDLGVARTERDLLADVAWVEEETARLMADDVHWQPGARELVAAVRTAGLRTALVTTTPRRIADLVLGHIGEVARGEPAFDVTVCGDEVPALKPDPAPYRQAMAALGVRPGECVVIEDSQAGSRPGSPPAPRCWACRRCSRWPRHRAWCCGSRWPGSASRSSPRSWPRCTMTCRLSAPGRACTCGPRPPCRPPRRRRRRRAHGGELHLVAAGGAGVLERRGEHGPADAAAPVRRVDDDVLDQ